MTELEQYKKAYALLAWKMDEAITRLEQGCKMFEQGEGDLAQNGGSLVRVVIGSLTRALLDAEDIFLDEDPEDA